ncbi:MAG TPA: GNAT family N-acetyltransferase, partial [Acidimicrobiales bacterium]
VVGHIALHRATGDPLTPLAREASGLDEEGLGVIARVFVTAAARRTGIAVALLEVAVAEAHRRGLRPALDVGVDLAPAIALYERLGWQRIGLVHFDLGEAVFDGWVYLGPSPP